MNSVIILFSISGQNGRIDISDFSGVQPYVTMGAFGNIVQLYLSLVQMRLLLIISFRRTITEHCRMMTVYYCG